MDFKPYEVQSWTIFSNALEFPYWGNGIGKFKWVCCKLEALKCKSIMQLRGISVGWIHLKCHRLKIGKKFKAIFDKSMSHIMQTDRFFKRLYIQPEWLDWREENDSFWVFHCIFCQNSPRENFKTIDHLIMGSGWLQREIKKTPKVSSTNSLFK